MKLFVTEQQEFRNKFPGGGFFCHYVDLLLDIQGIFWISIVENSVENVKNSGIPRSFPLPFPPGSSLFTEYSSAEVDVSLCPEDRGSVDAIFVLW